MRSGHRSLASHGIELRIAAEQQGRFKVQELPMSQSCNHGRDLSDDDPPFESWETAESLKANGLAHLMDAWRTAQAAQASEPSNDDATSKRFAVCLRDIKAAVPVVLKGELAKHAFSEGNKALATFHPSTMNLQVSLLFPVSLIGTKLAAIFGSCDAKAAVYLAAVLEYITAEVLELSGNVARQDCEDESVVQPRHIFNAFSEDGELNNLKAGACILGSGHVLSHCHFGESGGHLDEEDDGAESVAASPSAQCFCADSGREERGRRKDRADREDYPDPDPDHDPLLFAPVSAHRCLVGVDSWFLGEGCPSPQDPHELSCTCCRCAKAKDFKSFESMPPFAIRCIIAKVGCPKVNPEVFDIVRSMARDWLEELAKDSVRVARHAKHDHVAVEDAIRALAMPRTLSRGNSKHFKLWGTGRLLRTDARAWPLPPDFENTSGSGNDEEDEAFEGGDYCFWSRMAAHEKSTESDEEHEDEDHSSKPLFEALAGSPLQKVLAFLGQERDLSSIGQDDESGTSGGEDEGNLKESESSGDQKQAAISCEAESSKEDKARIEKLEQLKVSHAMVRHARSKLANSGPFLPFFAFSHWVMKLTSCEKLSWSPAAVRSFPSFVHYSPFVFNFCLCYEYSSPLSSWLFEF